MTRKKQLPQFTEDEKARVLAVLEHYLTSSETAISKFQAIKRNDDSGLAERNYNYWRNVKSGLKWVRAFFAD